MFQHQTWTFLALSIITLLSFTVYFLSYQPLLMIYTPELDQVHQGDAKYAGSDETRIAFFGDQGLKSSSLAVLWMLKEWKVDIIVHLGDFDYADDPDGFDAQISGVFGPSFPYLAAVGNHDVQEWSGYQSKLQRRLQKSILSDYCQGEVGINQNCEFGGVQIVLSGVGTLGEGHEPFIEQSLSTSNASFKVCAWHKNQHAYQTGDKSDEVGWPAYEICRNHGAMIKTGHTHTYARTHLIANYTDHVIASTSNNLILKKGVSFATVTGTGGYEIADFDGHIPPSEPYWAETAASSSGLTFGATLCTFNVKGNPNEAVCKYKDIKGYIWDEYTLKSELNSSEEFTP